MSQEIIRKIDYRVGRRWTRKPSFIETVNQVSEAKLDGLYVHVPVYSVQQVFRGNLKTLDQVSVCSDFDPSFRGPTCFIIEGRLNDKQHRLLVSTEGAMYVRYALLLTE